MAKLYGTIKADRGVATRTSNRSISACAQSYDGSIISTLYYDMDKKLGVRIDIEEGSSDFGTNTFFAGTLDELKEALSNYMYNKKEG